MGFFVWLGISPQDAPTLPAITDNVRDSGQTLVFGKADSGKRVDEKSAMQIATVYACVRLLAETVSGLPLQLYRLKDEDNAKERAVEAEAELNARIEELEQEIIKRTRARQEYDDLGKEILRLRDEKYELQLQDAKKEGMRQKLAELERTIEEIGGEVEEYDDMLVRRLIERITVFDDHFTVEFKSRIEIDV